MPDDGREISSPGEAEALTPPTEVPQGQPIGTVNRPSGRQACRRPPPGRWIRPVLFMLLPLAPKANDRENPHYPKAIAHRGETARQLAHNLSGRRSLAS